MKLTQAAVNALKKDGTDRLILDDGLPGFGVRIAAAGKKSFIARSRLNGRRVQVSIGSTDMISVAEARKEARQILGEIAAGRDPRRETRRKQESAITFGAFSQRWLDEWVEPRRSAVTLHNYNALLKKHVLPAIGTVGLEDVAFADLQALHRKLKAKPRTANAAVGMIRAVVNYAEKLQLRPQGQNPGFKFEMYQEKGRERFLSDEEAVRVADAIDQLDGNGLSPWTATAIRLLMLTGARSSEIRALEWSHIDRDRGLAVLPTSKNGSKRTLYLSPEAMTLIDRLPKRGRFVIAGNSIDVMCGALTKQWERVRELAKVEDVRLHDLRHTFASAALADGLPLALVGRILGHKTMQATSRYAHLANDPVAQAAQEVASKMARTMKGEAAATGNVVRLGKEKSAKVRDSA
ncbi:MAG: tyrosine-type recombinase/integrase [Pseudomonadota bacterium]